MASASSASLLESEGGAISGVQGQGPWAGGLGDAGGRSPPEANHIFSIKGSSVVSRGKAPGQGVWGRSPLEAS